MIRPALLAALLLAAGNAGAQEEPAPRQQPPCASLAKLTKFLAESYHENLAAAGLQTNGQLIEIFASPDGATWTAVTTSPAGKACVVAAGKHWMDASTEGAPA